VPFQTNEKCFAEQRLEQPDDARQKTPAADTDQRQNNDTPPHAPVSIACYPACSVQHLTSRGVY
jgi:hypothetical protein